MPARADTGEQALVAVSPFRSRVQPALRWMRDFPGRLEQAAEVRSWVEELLPECGQLEMLILLVSEVSANAMTHTASGNDHGRFGVLIEWAPEAVRAVILDQGAPTAPVIKVTADDAAWEDESGRGLLLVDQLADEWGTSTYLDGRLVWLELAWQAKGGPLPEAPGGYQAAAGHIAVLRAEYPGTTIWWGHLTGLWWAALPGACGEDGLVYAPTTGALSTVLADAFPAFRRVREASANLPLSLLADPPVLDPSGSRAACLESCQAAPARRLRWPDLRGGRMGVRPPRL